MTMKTYTVHRSMHGDGRDYEPGDTRELDEIDARDMLDSGAISLEGEEPAVRKPAVQHTFGQAEPSGHIISTTATTDERMTTARRGKAVAAPPAAAIVPVVPAPAV